MNDIDYPTYAESEEARKEKQFRISQKRQKAKQVLIPFLTALIIAAMCAVFVLGIVHLTHHELTYQTYWDQAAPVGMPPCTFVKHDYIDKSNPAQPFQNFYFTCAETGKNPTIQQQAFWIQYVLASDCQAGRALACDADVVD